ncbi:HNH endonuclease family protein [Microbacterium rhizophilus]|uniref:HNH endonuclease family protein n=1 Tax=Microbacterium rhizophilus TaxID=3138934 RepID=UPI0031F16C86
MPLDLLPPRPRARPRTPERLTVLWLSAVVLVVAAMLAAAGQTAEGEAGAQAPGPTPSATVVPDPVPSAAPTAAPPRAGTALAPLETLEVKGRAPKTGYTREQFGHRWKDVDRNGCDSRNDILARDLTGVARSGPCTVVTGSLADPYTGTTIAFVRGQGTSELVQIDHVVALSDAWQKGAQQLTPDERERFANDPLNLLAVDGSANASKGDGDAATWLPPVEGIRCAYVARRVAVKSAYRLWVTPAERDAIARILSGCPDEPAAASSTATGDGVA